MAVVSPQRTARPPSKARGRGVAAARPRRAGTGLAHPSGIVVLYSALEGTPADSVPLADRETIAVASDVARVLRENTDYAVQLLPAVSEVDRKLAPFPPRDWAVFNLFEGLDYRIGSDGITMDDEAPTALALETLGYRFTGADGRALALALNKASTKRILHDAGVPTPPWLVFDSVQQVTAEALRDLSFPLIVKPVAEDSSLAIDDKAVVINLDELLVRVALVTGEYHQPALVEAFIDGREINAAIWGNPPETLPLAEIDLSALGEPTRRIVSYAAKWEERTFEYAHTPAVCPALLPEELAHNIRATARCAWEQITHCRGYGRVDMRLQGETAYVLEVNPNPSIATDSGFARSARVAGLSFEQMILKILAFALEDNGVDHPSC